MVDDCSTDGTRALMATLASEHSNITCLHHEVNQGGGAARNTAVEYAKSEVIFCLDSDDLLPRETLNRMLAFLQKKQCDGVCFEHSVKFRGTDINDIDTIDTYPVTDTPIPLESLLQRKGIACPVMVVFMFTKESWQDIGGYPTHHGFDTQGFGVRFLAANKQAYICPESTYYHRTAFHESYYLREYNAGRTNFNLQVMLLERPQILTESARKFIENYPIKDFTRSLLVDLQQIDQVFETNPPKYYNPPTKSRTIDFKPIPRNSVPGILLRIRARVRKIL